MQEERKEIQQQGSDDICLYCELRGKHEPCWCKDKALQDKLATHASPPSMPAKVASAKPAGTITAKQRYAIQNLCHAKQRSVPFTLCNWSMQFASSYIRFLLALPFPRREQSRYSTVQDMHFAATHPKPRAYYWDDDDLDGTGPGTLPESVLACNATQPQGD